MREAEQVDHAAAGVAARQGGGERSPGRGILRARKQAVAIDRTCQRLRLAAQGVDYVVVVDAIDAHAVITTAAPRVGGDMGGAEEGLDPVVVDVNPQPLTDQPRGRGVEHAVNKEASGLRHPRNHLGEVGRLCCRHGFFAVSDCIVRQSGSNKSAWLTPPCILLNSVQILPPQPKLPNKSNA